MKALVLAAVVLGTTACAANAPLVASFRFLPDRVNLGDAVTVRDTDSHRWHGRVQEMASERFVLRIGNDDVMLSPDRVAGVAMCCDRLTDGPLLGFALGGGLGAWVASGFSDRGRAGDALLGLTFFGGVGAAIGFGLDVLIAREVDVYRAPSTTARLSVGASGRAIHVVLRW